VNLEITEPPKATPTAPLETILRLAFEGDKGAQEALFEIMQKTWPRIQNQNSL